MRSFPLTVIGARPYEDVRFLCRRVKSEWTAALSKKDIRILHRPLPSKCVLIPVPGHLGTATYTRDIAEVLSQRTGFPMKDTVVLDCLEGTPRESLCERKHAGETIGDINVSFRIKSKACKDTLRELVEKGYEPILFDNVVDTGTTAKAAMDALGQTCRVLAIGDTDTPLFFSR